jgi:hypothetical protein
MTRTILAALLLSACTAAPHRDWCDQPPKDLWTQRCDHGAAAAPAKPAPAPENPPHVEPPKEPPHVEPEKPSGLEPNRETDPQGWRDWKDSKEQSQ